MNFLKLIIFFLCLSITSTGYAQWDTFEFPSQNFKIDFPKKPKKEVDHSEDQTTFNISCAAYSSDGLDSNTLYMASCIQYKEELVLGNDPVALEDLFEGMIEGAVEAIDGKLLYVRDIHLGAIPGKQVKILFEKMVLGGKNVSRVRYYVVRDKIYLLQTITRPQNDNNHYIDKFMNSFDLLEDKAPEPKVKKL